jgi:hypothetical protein
MNGSCTVVMLAVACSAAAGQSAPAEAGLARAVALAQDGRYAQALSAADAGDSELDRAQARLYVRHRAGDLSGALAAGLAGLRAAPGDLWLLERVTYIAISLRATALARSHVERLAQAISSADLPDADRGRWRDTLASYRVQVAELEAMSVAVSSAETRARVTSVVGLGLAIALLWMLGRVRSRGAPS